MKNGLLKTLSFLCLFSMIACSNVNNEQSSINNIFSSINEQSSINNISSSIHDVITTSNIESSSSLDKTISSEEVSSSSIHVHTPSEKVIENKIEATCLDEGSYDEVIYCSTCKEELSREHKIVEALGHDYSSWVTIIEANENQDGKRKKECSRCHDIVEEIVPTTSPFTFVLDENNLSYQITGYNKLYEENETIIVPDKFNNLPVTSLSFTVQRVKPSKNPVKILLPLTINTFWGINVVFKEDGQANSSYFDSIDIYYQGSLTDFLSNINRHSILYHNPYNLFIKNNYEFEKVNCLVVPDGTKEIKDKQFYNFQFEELICPTSLVKIGKNCFAENFTLKKVSLNEGLVSIGIGAFSGTGIKSIEIPSTIIDNSSYNGWFTGCVDLLSITIKEGAKIVQKSLGDNHTVMLLDYSSDEHTTTFKDFTVTKDIASECEIFEYQHFSFLKRINEFYLIKYNGEEVDATLPSKIVYKDETINSYTVLSNALLSYCLLVGGENNSWGLSQAVYSKNANYGFPIQTLHFSSSVKAIESNGFGNAYLEQIYFDGSLSELKSVLKNAPMSKDNISTLLAAYSYVGKPRYRANNTIFYLDNNGEYASLDLTNCILD